MRAWSFERYGPFREVLSLREAPLPEPGPGQLRVRVRAIGLNFPDLLLVAGTYQLKPTLPATPCMEAAGVVDAVGEGSRFRVGQRVLVHRLLGLAAEAVVVPDGAAHVVPEGMSDAEAASFFVTYQTSYFALVHRAQLRAGETLLVHGAAGGVGSAAVQLGRALGARVIATAGGPDKVAVARRCGAQEAIDTRSQDFVAQVKALTQERGADVVYDPVGGDTFDKSTKVLAFEGRLLVIGFASGTIPTIAVNRLLLKTAAVVGLQWGSYLERAPEKIEAAHDALCALFARGQLAPQVFPRTFPLEALPDALDALARREAWGKVVVQVG